MAPTVVLAGGRVEGESSLLVLTTVSPLIVASPSSTSSSSTSPPSTSSPPRLPRFRTRGHPPGSQQCGRSASPSPRGVAPYMSLSGLGARCRPCARRVSNGARVGVSSRVGGTGGALWALLLSTPSTSAIHRRKPFRRALISGRGGKRSTVPNGPTVKRRTSSRTSSRTCFRSSTTHASSLRSVGTLSAPASTVLPCPALPCMPLVFWGPTLQIGRQWTKLGQRAGSRHFDQPSSSPSLPATHGYGFLNTTLALATVALSLLPRLVGRRGLFVKRSAFFESRYTRTCRSRAPRGERSRCGQ